MRTTLLRASVVACIALTPAQMMLAQDVPDVSALEIGDGPVATDALPVGLSSTREIQVVVQLSTPPLAAAQGPNAKRVGWRLGAGQQQQYTQGLGREQDALAAQIANLGGRETARMNKALNALVVEIDASRIAELRESLAELEAEILEALEEEMTPHSGRRRRKDEC